MSQLLNCRAKIGIIFIFAIYTIRKIAKCFIILYFILQNVYINITFMPALAICVHWQKE